MLLSYCTMVKATDEGRARCEAWWSELAKAATASGQREMKVCHAGPVYLAVSGKVKDETVAVVMEGNVAPASLQEKKAVKLAGELGLDKKLLAAARAVKGGRRSASETMTPSTFTTKVEYESFRQMRWEGVADCIW